MLDTTCLRVSIWTEATLIAGARLQFRGLVQCLHGNKHATMILEKELRDLYLDQQTAESELA